MAHFNKKYNTYDIESKEYGIGFTRKGEEFLFDKEDYDLIKKFCWSIAKTGYVEARDTDTKKLIYLHRLVMNFPKNKSIDHINHDKLDNRKENLRIVTQTENNANQRIRKDNVTGIKGVFKRKDTGKWGARITYHGTLYRKSDFNTIEEAIKWRKDKEEEFFGEYAYKDSH